MLFRNVCCPYLRLRLLNSGKKGEGPCKVMTDIQGTRQLDIAFMDYKDAMLVSCVVFEVANLARNLSERPKVLA